MTQTVEQILKTANLYTDDRDYVVVKLPSGAIMAAAGVVAEIGEPFCALIADKDEVSLVIPSEALDDFAPRLRGYIATPKNYRMITFDLELEMELVGFMAKIAGALAEAGVSILPLAAYSRDHILVMSDQINIAMAALEKLKSDSSE